LEQSAEQEAFTACSACTQYCSVTVTASQMLVSPPHIAWTQQVYVEQQISLTHRPHEASTEVPALCCYACHQGKLSLCPPSFLASLIAGLIAGFHCSNALSSFFASSLSKDRASKWLPALVHMHGNNVASQNMNMHR
jgi:hypothetical protein